MECPEAYDNCFIIIDDSQYIIKSSLVSQPFHQCRLRSSTGQGDKSICIMPTYLIGMTWCYTRTSTETRIKVIMGTWSPSGAQICWGQTDKGSDRVMPWYHQCRLGHKLRLGSMSYMANFQGTGSRCEGSTQSAMRVRITVKPVFVCSIWFFYVPSTFFQLCRDSSSLVEPVLS